MNKEEKILKEAIDFIEEYLIECPIDFHCGRCDDTRKHVANLKAISKALGEREWISVEDDLPTIGTNVLIFTSNSNFVGSVAHIMDDKEREICEKVYDREFQGLYWDSAELFHPINDVTHWMPLPEPPIEHNK